MGEEAKNLDQEELDNDSQASAEATSVKDTNEFEVVDTSETSESEQKEDKPARNPIRDMRNRLKDQNKELKQHRRESQEKDETIAKLTARVEALESGGTGGGAPAETATDDPAPTLEDCGYDQQELQKQTIAWAQRQTKNTVQQEFQTRDEQAARSAQNEEVDASIRAHYERAQSLNFSDFEAAEDKVAEILGVDIVQGIQATADNSELIVYHLYKNPEKARNLRATLDRSPAKFTFQLGQLASNLSLKPRESNAPNPDVPVPGGGGVIATAKERQWMKKLDEAYDSGDVGKVRQVRREAEADGVKLPYNQA